MKVLLVRHAIAEERGPRYPDDSLRPLTEAGIERMREAAAGIGQLTQPDRILTSPFLRAVQTAEILAERFSAPIETSQSLCVGDDDQLFEAVAWDGHGVVAAVGHEPLISLTLSNLLTGDQSSARVLFKKGAAALVECGLAPRPGGGTLEWLLQPAALRMLGRRDG